MSNEFPNKYPKAAHTYLGSFPPVSLLFPIGITLHYTATRGIGGTIKELAARDLGYHIIIGRDGTIHQCAEFNFRLNHAGKATWMGHSPNREHISVALESWGWLIKGTEGKFSSWSGAPVPASEIMERDCRWWDAATPEQELSLLKFLRWAIAEGIDVQNICGHNECAIPAGRKVDPGGVLSLSMDKFRDLLRDYVLS